MKTYKKSVHWSLISSVISTIIGISQVVINLYYERIFFVCLFGVLSVVFISIAILLSIDLITRDKKMMKVLVIEADEEIIKVLKPNGRKLRIRLPKGEINKFQANEELELTLTKRTGQILEINRIHMAV